MPLEADLYGRTALAGTQIERLAGELDCALAIADVRAEHASDRWYAEHGAASARWREDLAGLVREARYFGERLTAYLEHHPQALPRLEPAAGAAPRMLRFASTQERSAALVAPSSFNAADNTVEVIFTTGAGVVRSDYDGPYLEVLDVAPGAVRLGRLNAGAPFLNSHRSATLENIIGSVVPGTARLADGQGLARIKLSVDPAHAGIVTNVAAGVIRNVSVGYLIHHSDVTKGANGIPVRRITDWEPLEISAVAIPADPGAQMRAV